jgi:GDSL-like Lipase/Acylhydrolase family/Carbohydrate esterase 2 N-terminal
MNRSTLCLLATVVACSEHASAVVSSGAEAAAGAAGTADTSGSSTQGTAGCAMANGCAGSATGAATGIGSENAAPDASTDVATPVATADASVNGATVDTSVVVPPDSGGLAPVQFYGRWDFTPTAAITVNSGSHVTASFSGTGISARLDLSHSQAPVTTVTWQIDNGAWTDADVTANMMLASGLPAGEHTVVFMARGMEELFNRWDPPVVASLNFIGFDVQGGSLIPTARPTLYKVEFIGDSLTEGVRIVFPDGTDPWHTDGHLAYPCQTALALGAEWRQVGFGHQGILQAGHGNVPVAADSFNWVYATVPRDAWVADMVVVNQGTNDRDASPATFQPAFARYLSVIRAGYPHAKIGVLRPFGGYQQAAIAAAAAARVAGGDTLVWYVDTTGWLVATDYGADGIHPNLTGTGKIIAALVPELRKHM